MKVFVPNVPAMRSVWYGLRSCIRLIDSIWRNGIIRPHRSKMGDGTDRVTTTSGCRHFWHNSKKLKSPKYLPTQLFERFPQKSIILVAILSIDGQKSCIFHLHVLLSVYFFSYSQVLVFVSLIHFDRHPVYNVFFCSINPVNFWRALLDKATAQVTQFSLANFEALVFIIFLLKSFLSKIFISLEIFNEYFQLNFVYFWLIVCSMM